MHEGVDFLYEAVANSLEAGAKDISVKYYDEGNKVRVVVEDDGTFTFNDDLFDEGTSSKPNHSGRGLYLLKERCNGKVKIVNDGAKTQLRYEMEKDENYGRLRSILPLILARVGDQADFMFEHIKDGKSQLLYSKDYRYLNETETILKIRDIVQDWD